ncbi:hypothetical protein MKW92_006183 [Papaver armeniacum]|nr:hypothetical protein MKW92_006183 [Papaver armeniacum]
MTNQDIKKIIDNLTEQAIVTIQSPLMAFEEKYYEPPQRKCTKCGKLKKSGRQVVNVVDAVRRFNYFGTQHQQPSSTQYMLGLNINNLRQLNICWDPTEQYRTKADAL